MAHKFDKTKRTHFGRFPPKAQAEKSATINDSQGSFDVALDRLGDFRCSTAPVWRPCGSFLFLGWLLTGVLGAICYEQF
jgi:hypothetical protein